MIVSDPSIPPFMHNFIMDKVSFVQPSSPKISSLLCSHRSFAQSFNPHCLPACRCAELRTLLRSPDTVASSDHLTIRFPCF